MSRPLRVRDLGRDLALDAAGGRCSLGRKLLQAWLADHTQIELARRVGCDRSALSKLAAGRRVPDLRLAVAIERELSIPTASWLK